MKQSLELAFMVPADKKVGKFCANADWTAKTCLSALKSQIAELRSRLSCHDISSFLSVPTPAPENPSLASACQIYPKNDRPSRRFEKALTARTTSKSLICRPPYDSSARGLRPDQYRHRYHPFTRRVSRDNALATACDAHDVALLKSLIGDRTSDENR